VDEENVTVDESAISTSYVPESEKSSFMAFVKKALGGIDLSKISAPPFILAPYSLLETNADLMSHPDIFCGIATETTALKRILAYAKWYISKYHRQNTVGSGKKPYNPILGEQFKCKWESQDFGTLTLLSEQVSHHPPILGEYYENAKSGIIHMAHFGLKSNFAGTIVKGRVEASSWTRLIKLEEDYVHTSPTFIIRGFLVANPYFDIVGDVILHCPQSDYKVVLEFKEKPWFRGEYHQITGRVYHENDPENILYTFSGNWKKVVYIHEVSSGNKEVFFDCDWEMADRIVAPLEEQTELESQKVWKEVTEALREFNYSQAGQAKSKIEDRQRVLARERAETGEKYDLEYFYFDEASDRWLLKNYEQRFQELRNNLK